MYYPVSCIEYNIYWIWKFFIELHENDFPQLPVKKKYDNTLYYFIWDFVSHLINNVYWCFVVKYY